MRTLLLLLLLWSPIVHSYPIPEFSDDLRYFRLYNPDHWAWFCYIESPVFGEASFLLYPDQYSSWWVMALYDTWKCNG